MIDSLRGVTETDSAVTFGAAVTHAEIEDGAVPDPTGGWIREAAANIANRAVRNRGTLGGSLCHADLAADWATIMIALFATAIVEGRCSAQDDGASTSPDEVSPASLAYLLRFPL